MDLVPGVLLARGGMVGELEGVNKLVEKEELFEQEADSGRACGWAEGEDIDGGIETLAKF